MAEVNLPESWVLARYDDVYLSASNGTGGTQNKERQGIPVSRIETIANENIDYDRIGFLAEYDKDKVEKHKLVKGDILFSHINSPIHLGKTAIYDGEQSLYHGINLLRIVVDRQVVLPQVFNWHCKYTRGLGEFSLRAQHAVNQSSLNQKKLGEFEMPLPPLAEQKVIAEKLDTLLAQVDNTKARLERIPEILKRFRQSVLAAAVSGKLTEEWRALSSKPNSTVSELPENNKTRRGLPDGVAYPNALEGFCFPDDWNVLSVASLLRKGVIIDLKDGNHGANHPKSSEFTQEGLPFITAAQMSDDGRIDYDGAPKVSGEPLAKLKVGFSDAGDVIYSHKGTVGRVGIADRASVLSPQTTYIRLNQKYVLNRFYALMLKSHAFTTQVDAIKSQTTRDFVPITAHYSLFAVIPQLEEQTEIVRRVEELFAFADRIEHAAQAALSRVNNLTQSILAKAFRGELTADWRAANPELISGENSAEALLARIKAERAKLSQTQKGRGKSVEN